MVMNFLVHGDKKIIKEGIASSEDFTTDLKFIFSSDRDFSASKTTLINKNHIYQKIKILTKLNQS